MLKAKKEWIKRITAGLLVALLLSGLCSCEVIIEDVSDEKSAYETAVHTNRALLSSVAVYCGFTTQSSGYPWGGSGTGTSTSWGSGVIYKIDKEAGDAYIITNFHVVYDCDSTTANGISDNINLFVYGNFYTESMIPAKYVGGSADYDIAVLKVTGSEFLKNSDVRAIDVADSDRVGVGDIAVAIGNPEGMGISATEGIVSVESEYIDMASINGSGTANHRVIRIDTAVNSGNSGGGLFNSKGELIGIVNAKLADSSVEGIGYAIPSNVAIAAAQNIIDNCDGEQKTSVMKCTVGVTVSITESSAVYDETSGKVRIYERVVISEVGVGSAADGILQKGDRLLSITMGEKKILCERMHDLVDSMLNVREGDTVIFEVERGEKILSLEITFGAENITACN